MAQQSEFESLAEYLIGFAQKCLESEGEFYPTAAFINSKGSMEALAVHIGDYPDPVELYAAYIQNLQREAKTHGYRAAGICADGLAANPRGGEKTDAILILLEHQSGDAITLVMQYRRAANGVFEYAETFAVKKHPEVFI